MAALVSASGCGGRRDVAARDTAAFDRAAPDLRLRACLAAAARVPGDSATRAAVARCAALVPAPPGGLRVIGIIKDTTRRDSAPLAACRRCS
jgi:hypothetical protein